MAFNDAQLRWCWMELASKRPERANHFSPAATPRVMGNNVHRRPERAAKQNKLAIQQNPEFSNTGFV